MLVWAYKPTTTPRQCGRDNLRDETVRARGARGDGTTPENKTRKDKATEENVHVMHAREEKPEQLPTEEAARPGDRTGGPINPEDNAAQETTKEESSSSPRSRTKEESDDDDERPEWLPRKTKEDSLSLMQWWLASQGGAKVVRKEPSVAVSSAKSSSQEDNSTFNNENEEDYSSRCPFEDPTLTADQRASFLCTLLQYVLFAGIMPPWVHFPLVKIVQTLKEKTTLAECVPWASCDAQTWKTIQQTFQYMLETNVFREKVGNQSSFGQPLKGYRFAREKGEKGVKSRKTTRRRERPTRTPIGTRWRSSASGDDGASSTGDSDDDDDDEEDRFLAEMYEPHHYHSLFDLGELMKHGLEAHLEDDDEDEFTAYKTFESEFSERPVIAGMNETLREETRRDLVASAWKMDRRHFEDMCQEHGVTGANREEKIEKLTDVLLASGCANPREEHGKCKDFLLASGEMFVMKMIGLHLGGFGGQSGGATVLVLQQDIVCSTRSLNHRRPSSSQIPHRPRPQ